MVGGLLLRRVHAEFHGVLRGDPPSKVVVTEHGDPCGYWSVSGKAIVFYRGGAEKTLGVISTDEDEVYSEDPVGRCSADYWTRDEAKAFAELALAMWPDLLESK